MFRFLKGFIRYSMYRFMYKHLSKLIALAIASGGIAYGTGGMEGVKDMGSNLLDKASSLIKEYSPDAMRSIKMPDLDIGASVDSLSRKAGSSFEELTVAVKTHTPSFPTVANAAGFTDPYMRNCDQVLNKGFYHICYDYGYKGAKYVTYDLDGSLVNKVNIKKRPRFYPDKEIPREYRTYPKDYSHNRFRADRGHIYSDSAADHSQKTLNGVYTMANIIPQHRSVNRFGWKRLEKYERLAATKLGKVHVVNGIEYGNNPKRLKKSGIAYPVGYWKKITGRNFERCFYYKNELVRNPKADKMRDHEVSCSSL